MRKKNTYLVQRSRIWFLDTMQDGSQDPFHLFAVVGPHSVARYNPHPFLPPSVSIVFLLHPAFFVRLRIGIGNDCPAIPKTYLAFPSQQHFYGLPRSDDHVSHNIAPKFDDRGRFWRACSAAKSNGNAGVGRFTTPLSTVSRIFLRRKANSFVHQHSPNKPTRACRAPRSRSGFLMSSVILQGKFKHLRSPACPLQAPTPACAPFASCEPSYPAKGMKAIRTWISPCSERMER